MSELSGTQGGAPTPDVALGAFEPALRSDVDFPGPATRALEARLRELECPAFPARRDARASQVGELQVPLVYARAHGDNVLDADGNRYVDLTAGFGALALGHTAPAINAAVARALNELPLALGDVYGSEHKAKLMTALAARFPLSRARVLLGMTGADAVTAALKSAQLATKKPGVLAFEGAYHGLSYAPLAACGLSAQFRQPFAETLSKHVQFAPFPRTPAELDGALQSVRRALAGGRIGAVLVEPVLGRGGCIAPPATFLPELRALADEVGALLLVDEVWTGLGRSGAWLASAPVVPDVLCLGKALGGGLPISACIGRDEVMRAWGDFGGSTIHTSTHAGAPLGCAAALAVLHELEARDLPARSARVGAAFRAQLEARGLVTSGAGLMVGIDIAASRARQATHARGETPSSRGNALAVSARLLRHGYITLAGGPQAEHLTLTPALTVAEPLLEGFVDALCACL